MAETSDGISWEIVQVSEKVNDENSDELRAYLLNLLNNEQFKIRFDFSQVKKINAITIIYNETSINNFSGRLFFHILFCRTK